MRMRFWCYILTTERHGPTLLTDKVIRDFCGNSFHPSLISAALGTDDQLQQWVEGNNDAQPCCKDLLSRSLYRSHVLNTFFGPVLRAMMKQVCWHSRRSEAHRGLPEARPRTSM